MKHRGWGILPLEVHVTACDPYLCRTKTITIMRTRPTTFCMLFSTLLAVSCGVDSKPGPAVTEQAEYDEPSALSCTSMNGRAYVITMSSGAPATDTIIFASDRIEAVGRVAAGFLAAPYTCAGKDSLLITAEMPAATTGMLRWSATALGDALTGTVAFSRPDTVGEVVSSFTGVAIAGANATLRTPQRQLDSY